MFMLNDPATPWMLPPQDSKRKRLDWTHHEDGTSVPLSSLDVKNLLDTDHPKKVLEGLNRLRLNSTLFDVVLCCEGEEVPCHRTVLASFSPYFEAMFTCGMMESTQEKVTISGVEPQMMRLLVNYGYTSKVSISTDNVQALLAASDLLDVTPVLGACLGYMKDHLDINNCVEFYCCADDHSCEELKKPFMEYILEHFSVIYQQEAFLSLSVVRLTEVLSSDHLNVPKEDMVFEAAMLWLDKCPTRMQSFEKVLQHIRLPLISPSYLHTVVEPRSQRFISDAKGPYCNTSRPRRTTVIVALGQTKTLGEGFEGDEIEVDKVESFDPLTNQWKTLDPLPDDISGYAVVASGSTLYLAGGQVYDDRHRVVLNTDVWRYDVHYNSWSNVAPMNKPCYELSLVMLDGYVFAVGDWGVDDSMERYDPNTDTWQIMHSVGVAWSFDSNSCNVVALDGELYFIGGDPIHFETKRPQVVTYNPKTSVWTEVAPMQIPRNKSAACVLNGKIYVTGGLYDDDDRTMENRMECYNPETNQWTMCAPMQVKRSSPSMAAMDGLIFVHGGQDFDDHDDDSPARNVECYFEETDTWETVGKISNARAKCVSLKLRRDHGHPIDDDSEGD